MDVCKSELVKGCEGVFFFYVPSPLRVRVARIGIASVPSQTQGVYTSDRKHVSEPGKAAIEVC